MCRIGHYFLTVKRKCKHRMEVTALQLTEIKNLIPLLASMR